MQRHVPLRRTPFRRRRRTALEAAFDRAYVRVREYIYRRDGYRCVHCERADALTPQHVVKRSHGGPTHDPAYIVTLCGGFAGSCHDRADNTATGYGRLWNVACGDECFEIYDERSGEHYLYDARAGVCYPVPTLFLDPR